MISRALKLSTQNWAKVLMS